MVPSAPRRLPTQRARMVAKVRKGLGGGYEKPFVFLDHHESPLSNHW